MSPLETLSLSLQVLILLILLILLVRSVPMPRLAGIVPNHPQGQLELKRLLLQVQSVLYWADRS